jgi:hypothetical protein
VLKKVEDAVGELAATPPDRHGAIVKLESAAGDVENAVKQGLLGESAGEALLDQLARAARLLAVDALEEARGGGAGKLEDVRRGACRGRRPSGRRRLPEGDHELQAVALQGGGRVEDVANRARAT